MLQLFIILCISGIFFHHLVFFSAVILFAAIALGIATAVMTSMCR